MATSLADPPPASGEQTPGSGSPDAPEGRASPGSQQPTCTNCGAPMDPTQHWCLVCGAGTPGSLAATAPRWRLAALVLGISALLLAGAAAAAYAAWAKPAPGTHHVVEIVEQPAAASTVPGSSTPSNSVGTPTTITPSSSKPPTIPAATPTPTSSSAAVISPPTSTAQSTATSPKTTTEPRSSTPAETQPTPISLDTNAASTYNPYHYPASRFGDPSLTIDGDPSTGWTAQVDPAVAPKMAEGVLVDLKSAQKLSAMLLITSSPGTKVQVYGSSASTAPTSITSPEWVSLSSLDTVKNRHSQIQLRDSTKAFRFVALWISQAPPGSTAQSPGRVIVNEIELLPA